MANAFGKRHDNTLQAIQRLDCSDRFRLLNFQETSYLDDQGKAQPMVEMSRDGFSFLAMGFTGKKAAIWKERYIDAFGQMERALLTRQSPDAVEARQQGKIARRQETDVIAEFVDYAESQGSTNARHYYINITTMTYRGLGFIAKVNGSVRDFLRVAQAAALTLAEVAVIQALRDGMRQGLGYKAVFQMAKNRVLVLAAALPPTCLQIEGQEVTHAEI